MTYEGHFDCYMHRETVAVGPSWLIVKAAVEVAVRDYMREPRVMAPHATLRDAESGAVVLEGLGSPDGEIEWLAPTRLSH